MRASGAAGSVGGGVDGAGDAAGGGTRPVMVLGGTPNIMTWQKRRRVGGISAAARQAGEALNVGAIGTVGVGGNGGGGAGGAAGGGISHVMMPGAQHHDMAKVAPATEQWAAAPSAAQRGAVAPVTRGVRNGGGIFAMADQHLDQPLDQPLDANFSAKVYAYAS